MHDPKKEAERDTKWMRRYLHGEVAAFDSIYEAYSDAVYGYLTKRVRVVEERDELFQKIWMKFHRSREQWTPDYPLLQWIFVISRSVLIDRRRELTRTTLDRADHPGEDLNRRLDGIPSERPSPEEALLEARDQDEAEAMLGDLASEGLTPDQIRVVRLRAIDEEEYERIAERLGKSPENVRKIYSRAIERLRTLRWRPASGRNR